MRKPFVLAWAISPEQVVQFVKGQTTGWSIQSKKRHATFKHISWNAALQQLICRREGWRGAREGLTRSCFSSLHPALQFTPRAFPFLSFLCRPQIRGCSKSVSLSWGLFTHLGPALLQSLLKPLISVSFLLCGMIFTKGVMRSRVGSRGMNYLLTDSIRNGQMRTTSIGLSTLATIN